MEADEITTRRLNHSDWDYALDLTIRGTRIGDTGKARWIIVQDGDAEYDEQYVADVLEKVVLVIRGNTSDL